MSESDNKFDLGFENENEILPYNCEKGDVILIEGPRGTFKQTIAIFF